ncbi:MAG: 3-dehydroquinate synthase [Akkermansia sp.]
MFPIRALFLLKLADQGLFWYKHTMPTVSLSLNERSYHIHVENGALERVGELAYRAGMSGKMAVIADTNTAALYGDHVLHSFDSAGFTVSMHIIPAGEASKSMSMAEELCSELVKAGIDRSSNIAALGGGVVGDLAGFVSAIYYRGLPFMQIPTTIVAQTDSSVGGKTAINIAEGKNLVGAFHQPKVVVVDPTTLVTLDNRIISEGLAEAVKHAAIRDATMLPKLKELGNELPLGFSLNTIQTLPELMARNIAIKARIVEEDEKETHDVRALLNFGHTIGHGIEASRPYGEILHGEAVALGMRAALYISSRKTKLTHKDSHKILATLKALNLPLMLPKNVDPSTVLEKIATDKKFQSGKIRFVLLSALGEAFVSDDVTMEDIKDAITELQHPVS